MSEHDSPVQGTPVQPHTYPAEWRKSRDEQILGLAKKFKTMMANDDEINELANDYARTLMSCQDLNYDPDSEVYDLYCRTFFTLVIGQMLTV